MLENELQNSWRLSIPFNRFQWTISIHQFQSIKLGALLIKKLYRNKNDHNIYLVYLFRK